MKKIPCVFVRKHIHLESGEPFDERQKGTRYLAIDSVNPGCEWVLEGEGYPTIKWDGTAVLALYNAHDKRDWYQRYQGHNPPQYPGKTLTIRFEDHETLKAKAWSYDKIKEQYEQVFNGGE